MILKHIILEELSDEQKRMVDTWSNSGMSDKMKATIISHHEKRGEPGPKPEFWNMLKATKATELSKHVIPEGQDRVSIPLVKTNERKEEAPSIVISALKRHGHSIHDYEAGLATDPHGRTVKIGKALNSIHQKNLKLHQNGDVDSEIASGVSEDALDKWKYDSNRFGLKAKHDDLHVVISRHPYDVAGMSTNRGWTSCMKMSSAEKAKDGGLHEDTLKHDIHEGTHVAYLTHKNDHNIENPIARIAIKPYTAGHGEESHTILRPEQKVYGTGPDAFQKTVGKWSRDNFPVKDEHGTYMFHDKLYSDSSQNTISNFNPHLSSYKHWKQLSPWNRQYALSSAESKLPLKHKIFDAVMKDSDHPTDAYGSMASHGTEKHQEFVFSKSTGENQSMLPILYENGSHTLRKKVLDTATNTNVLRNLVHAIKRDDDHGAAQHLAKRNFENSVTASEVGNNLAREFPSTHQILADHENPMVRAAVAQHTSNPHILTKLTNDNHPAVVDLAAANQHTPFNVKLNMLKNPNISRSTVESLRTNDLSEHLKDLSPSVIQKIATTNLHPNTLNAIRDAPEVTVKDGVTSHTGLLANNRFVNNRDNLAKFINHTNLKVREKAREWNDYHFGDTEYVVRENPEHS